MLKPGSHRRAELNGNIRSVLFSKSDLKVIGLLRRIARLTEIQRTYRHFSSCYVLQRFEVEMTMEDFAAAKSQTG